MCMGAHAQTRLCMRARIHAHTNAYACIDVAWAVGEMVGLGQAFEKIHGLAPYISMRGSAKFKYIMNTYGNNDVLWNNRRPDPHSNIADAQHTPLDA